MPHGELANRREAPKERAKGRKPKEVAEELQRGANVERSKRAAQYLERFTEAKDVLADLERQMDDVGGGKDADLRHRVLFESMADQERTMAITAKRLLDQYQGDLDDGTIDELADVVARAESHKLQAKQEAARGKKPAKKAAEGLDADWGAIVQEALDERKAMAPLKAHAEEGPIAGEPLAFEAPEPVELPPLPKAKKGKKSPPPLHAEALAQARREQVEELAARDIALAEAGRREATESPVPALDHEPESAGSELKRLKKKMKEQPAHIREALKEDMEAIAKEARAEARQPDRAQELQNEIHDLLEGAEAREGNDFKEVRGLKDIEQELSRFDIDADEAMVSPWKRFKIGLRGVFQPRVTALMHEYRTRMDELAAMKAELDGLRAPGMSKEGQANRSRRLAMTKHARKSIK